MFSVSANKHGFWMIWIVHRDKTADECWCSEKFLSFQYLHIQNVYHITNTQSLVGVSSDHINVNQLTKNAWSNAFIYIKFVCKFNLNKILPTEFVSKTRSRSRNYVRQVLIAYLELYVWGFHIMIFIRVHYHEFIQKTHYCWRSSNFGFLKMWIES